MGLIERFVEVASYLKESSDASENWAVRIEWLQALVAELWRSRGLYPGLAAVMSVLKFPDAISFAKREHASGREREAKQALFSLLEGQCASIPTLKLDEKIRKGVQRQWKLLSPEQQMLLRDVFPRCDLNEDQIERVLAEERQAHGIYAPLKEVADNPYLLCCKSTYFFCVGYIR